MKKSWDLKLLRKLNDLSLNPDFNEDRQLLKQTSLPYADEVILRLNPEIAEDYLNDSEKKAAIEKILEKYNLPLEAYDAVKYMIYDENKANPYLFRPPIVLIDKKQWSLLPGSSWSALRKKRVRSLKQSINSLTKKLIKKDRKKFVLKDMDKSGFRYELLISENVSKSELITFIDQNYDKKQSKYANSKYRQPKKHISLIMKLHHLGFSNPDIAKKISSDDFFETYLKQHEYEKMESVWLARDVSKIIHDYKIRK